MLFENWIHFGVPFSNITVGTLACGVFELVYSPTHRACDFTFLKIVQTFIVQLTRKEHTGLLFIFGGPYLFVKSLDIICL